MKRMQILRESEEGQARCKQMFKLGEQLVDCALRGQLSRFQRLAMTAESGDILMFHVIKMLHGSLKLGHLLLAEFIIDNGFPINKNLGSVPNCLHESLRVVGDERGMAIVDFLLTKKMDINIQEPQNWDTALHIAIRRNLFGCCAALIAGGADVNAIAKGDIMPLNLAEASLCDNEEERAALIALLLEKGARRTWRRQAPGSTPPAPVSPWGQRYQTTMIRSNANHPGSKTPAVPAQATTPASGKPASGALEGLTSALKGVNIKVSGDATNFEAGADENGWVFSANARPTPTPPEPPAALSTNTVSNANTSAPTKKVSFGGGFGNNSVQESVRMAPPSHLFSTSAPTPVVPARAPAVPAPAVTSVMATSVVSSRGGTTTTTTINRQHLGESGSLSSFLHSKTAGGPSAEIEDMEAPGVADGKGSFYRGVPANVDIDLPLPKVFKSATQSVVDDESARGACAGVSFEPSARSGSGSAAGSTVRAQDGAQIFSTGSGQIFSTERS